MASLRLRHPQGVSTLQLDFDSATVGDLQQQIFSASQIPPSQQEIKSGYPPRSLTVIPELPLSSLGLKPGEQIIVNQRAIAATVQAPTAGRTTVPISGSFSPPAPQSVTTSSSTGPAYVETSESSVLVHRVVPDDNSCLFSSVALIFEQDITKAQKMRQIVANGIQSNAETYSDAILGMPRDKYISTILSSSTWGGAIELGVLANHFGTEITSIDVETGRIDRFAPAPEKSRGDRPVNATLLECILIYSGIHYDAATLSPMVGAPAEWDQTVFPIMSIGEDDPVLEAGQRLAAILRERRAFTNMATFDLKCEICGKGLRGEKEARTHAQETGHTRFGEY
ncbi:hypothetical protein EDD17DRAFT_1805999 [Pisolithus thermaeus]|nr:hypothetical protein EDD17DRAFT_1805999 [Pisolithus thermaeus]